MRSQEIFQAIRPELASQILEALRDHDRDAHRAALAQLAALRKLRPVFIQRKPRADQSAWMTKTLRLRQAESIGEHILQIWLMASKKDMLSTFLDSLEIEHEDGAVEGELPDSFEPAKLSSAVDALLASHAADEVTIYLHLFQEQKADGWPELAEILTTDLRLTLSPTADPAPSDQPATIVDSPPEDTATATPAEETSEEP
jgi:hypothetical protein